jgi:hypothetical protein
MGRVLGIVLVIALTGFSHVSHGADANWIAVSTMEKGTQQNCGNSGQSNWQVEIKGNTLKYTVIPSGNRSFTLDLKSLQPDGAGRAVGKDDKNREFYVTFEPGNGPRVFHVTNSINACGYLFTPKN